MIDGDKRCGCGRGHETFGACLRAKHIRLGDLGHGTVKQFDADQQAYADARWQGIQPSSPLRPDVDRAVRISNEQGVAWKGEAVTGGRDLR